MIAKGDSDQQIFDYIQEISSRIPYGIINPTTKKIVTKYTNSLPPPTGISPITKPVKLSATPRQPVSLINAIKTKSSCLFYISSNTTKINITITSYCTKFFIKYTTKSNI